MKISKLETIKEAIIMVVEDNPNNLQLIVKLLKSEGYTVRPANTGELALQSVKTFTPDLILLDINLPGLSGYEVCKILKKDEVTCDIPVIFMSALDEVDDKANGFGVGGVDYITKPFEPIEVLSRINTHLHIRFSSLKLAKSNSILQEEIERRKKLELSLNFEKEQFKTTLFSIGDGLISVDVQGNVLIMNNTAEQLTGWTQEEAFGQPMEVVFKIINEYTRERCENPISKVLETGNIIELANHTILISKDGTERSVEDSAAPIKDEQGNINGVVLVFRDFTEKKQKQERIEFLSYNDQLTGLYNRRYYEQEIIRLDDERYYPLTLIMADINGLKLTNDAFGHNLGDLLLQRISSILKKECRENDIVARIGGDEFVLLLPETDAKKAEIIINRINTAIESEKIDNITLSISMGYAVKQDNIEFMDEIFLKAEDSMYRQKLSESSSIRGKTIDLIMSTLFEKSNIEMLHSKRVGEFSKVIAEKMSFDNEEVNEIKVSGLMHDIGKINIQEATLNKPQNLSNDEWLEIKRHSETGHRILSTISEFSKIAIYVLEHHERWDGKGYPIGLKGNEISLQARIIAVAEAYDAMISDRPYRKAYSKSYAKAEMMKCAGTQFDPEVVKVFFEKCFSEEKIVDNY